VGDFLTLEIPAGAFDLVLMNNNLYYFSAEKHPELFARVRSRMDTDATFALQIPMPTRHWIARAVGIAPGAAAFDLFLRGHANLYGLPAPAELHASLRAAGFRSTGETPILPGGAASFVWARV
jgi:trans-aconitate methyltransferase